MRPGEALAELVRALYASGSALELAFGNNPGYGNDLTPGRRSRLSRRSVYPSAVHDQARAALVHSARWKRDVRRGCCAWFSSVALASIRRRGNGLWFHGSVRICGGAGRVELAFPLLSAGRGLRAAVAVFGGACFISHTVTVKETGSVHVHITFHCLMRRQRHPPLAPLQGVVSQAVYGSGRAYPVRRYGGSGGGFAGQRRSVGGLQ